MVRYGYNQIKEGFKMGKINIKNVYEDRLIQVRNDIKKAIFNKKWTELAKLKAEESRLNALINE